MRGFALFLVLIGITSMATAQIPQTDEEKERCIRRLCGSGLSSDIVFIVQIALDSDTDGVGGGACLGTEAGDVEIEGCTDVVVGDQDFTREHALTRTGMAYAQGAGFQPQGYVGVQLYLHGKYPFDIGVGGARFYPLAGPRMYYWNPEDCDSTISICFDSETSFGFDVGVGAGVGPFSAEVFTGLGDVPSVSARVRYQVLTF